MEFLHVGMKVDDIERSRALYGQLFGMKWEPVSEYALADAVLEGEVSPSRSLVSHGWTSDGTEIEMVQVVEGRTADHLVLGDREGLSHVAFCVDDLTAAVTTAEAAGLRRVSEWASPAVDFVFLSGAALGGLLVQLVQFKEPRAVRKPDAAGDQASA
jgi:catechol 2,3-dioxygenase-like lactoylglutathione lyase family enzyme